MIFLIVPLITILLIVFGKILLKKWFNHITIYCVIWSLLILLYEWKLIPFVNLIPIAWFYITSAFLSFLLGITTVISARSLYPKDKIFNKKSIISLDIFEDDGKILKYSIILFSTISLYAAIQHWMILIDLFGSIPAVFLNANTIYRLNVQGGIKGVLPFIPTIGYVAVFFTGIYTAYKRKFSFLTFFPFIGIIIKELATVGRAGMLLALLEFVFSFMLFRNLLNDDLFQKFKFSKKNAVFAITILVVFFVTSASLVRITRSSTENYNGTNRELRQLKDNLFISPSIYLYFSSDVGVLSQYLKSEDEKTGFGENTFMPVYLILAKIGVVQRPSEYQQGYFIPMWSNTGTYIRELHADFGLAGVFLGPYLIGLIITWLWYKFYEEKSLIVFAILVYFYLIVGFSFLVMITRLFYWFYSLLAILLYIPLLKKMVRISQSRSST